MAKNFPAKKLRKAKVVRGSGRGAKIGLPTINLDPSVAGGLKEGIYVCRIFVPRAYWGVLHFGPRPTFDDQETTLEVHLLGFDDKVKIPSTVNLEVYDYIREIIGFGTPYTMLRKIDEDIDFAKKRIKNYLG